MKQKKKLLEKIIRKDYNNELEIVLEEKDINEDVKSTLLSILYKIEMAYKDLEIVKRDVEKKDEYVKNIIDIIKNKCNSIKIVKINDQNAGIPLDKTYIINKENKEILAYPIERKILYAILKIANKEKIIKDDYFLIDETLSELINVGYNINKVEPLRDFNGYSWSIMPQEIESIDHNLIYQNLRILLGSEFLNKWVKNEQFIIDYYDLLKDKLETLYGNESADSIIDNINKLSILLHVKFNKEKKEKFLKMKDYVEDNLKHMKNKKKYTEDLTKRKMELRKVIKKLDTIITDKKLLEKEYKERNEKLELKNKIFSIKILIKALKEERKEYIKELESINENLKPKNFIKKKDDLEEKSEYLKILEKNEETEIKNIKMQIQKTFINMINEKILKITEKEDIEKMIFDFRYYLYIPFDRNDKVGNIKEIEEEKENTIKSIINKAIELNVINKASENKDINYEILKNLFNSKIINLEDACFKLKKENEQYFVQLFDENVFDEKIEIKDPKDQVLFNRLNKIWI